ncbi:hypothetical protein JZ751_001179 [Albula glossodonta]|uniref:TMEM248/TMEM219 domain-containing protein n=1 Tax=Albula glossodonta TaxID=121402 RepID=A0A8T2PT13_9TELE|nr:hypothetical protein JZ751_001179 [Albula glossodonta]
MNAKHEAAAPSLVEHETVDGIPSNTSNASFAFTHLSMLVPLALTDSSQGRSLVRLQTTLWGSELGLKGSAGNKSLNLTLLFYSQPGQTNSGSVQTGSRITCLRVTAPSHILPQIPHPPVCPVIEDQDNDHSPLKIITSAQRNSNPKNALECYYMQFTPDHNLTVMLSQEEKDLAGQHLIMVSACLLSLCGVLCCFASLSCLKSRRYHGNGLDLQKDPLIDS